MVVHRRVIVSSQAAHQNIRLGVYGGLFFGEFSTVDQGLDVGVVHGALDELGTVVLVNAGIPGVRPMAVTARIDEESRHRAVRFFFCRNGCQLDHDVGFLHDLVQGRGSIIGRRVVALKQLARGHHDLVRCLAPATSAAHTIGNDGKNAAIDPRVLDQGDLVLLVVAVTFVDARGSGEFVADGHGGLIAEQYFIRGTSLDVLST